MEEKLLKSILKLAQVVLKKEYVHGIVNSVFKKDKNSYGMEILTKEGPVIIYTTNVENTPISVLQEKGEKEPSETIKKYIKKYNNMDPAKKFNRVYYIEKGDDNTYNVKNYGEKGKPYESFAVDTIVFKDVENDPKVLLIERSGEKGNKVAIPGGFVDPGESFKEAALRELEEETGISNVGDLTQIGSFRAEERLEFDPRMVGTTVFYTVLKNNDQQLRAQEGEVSNLGWFSVEEVDNLNFTFGDHKKFIQTAMKKLGLN